MWKWVNPADKCQIISSLILIIGIAECINENVQKNLQMTKNECGSAKLWQIVCANVYDFEFDAGFVFYSHDFKFIFMCHESMTAFIVILNN